MIWYYYNNSKAINYKEVNEMNATLVNEILSSGNKVLSTLNEAKETLSSAECWGNKEDLKSKCSFLTIIDGTKNRMAQAVINQADDELEYFSSLLSSVSHTYAEKLNGVTLPESIQSKSMFDSKVSHEEYEHYQAQIDQAIKSVSDIMDSISK